MNAPVSLSRSALSIAAMLSLVAFVGIGTTVSTSAAETYTWSTLRNSAGTPLSFYVPASLAIDASNQLYVAEWYSGTIFRVAADGTAATPVAAVGAPTALTTDRQGNLYVMGIYDIFKVTPAGVVTVVATLWNDPVRLYMYPQGLAVDPDGNIYATDYTNHCIRRITPTGTFTTVAGTAGRFDFPAGIVFDSAGNLFVADASAATISKVTPGGIVTTFAGAINVTGSADGPGSEARFGIPISLAIDGAGNLYVADTEWDLYAPAQMCHTIRKISSTGVVTTIGGLSGVPGHIDGPGNVARFHIPLGLAVDAVGNVYVGEEGNHAIRKGVPSYPPVIAQQPVMQLLEAGGALVLSVAADTDRTSCTYQWQRDGVAISGATDPTYTLPCVQSFHAGAYSVVVTNEYGSTTSAAATITVSAPPLSDSRLLNVSTRALCRTGDQILIPGFVIEGSANKRLLIRAVGPTLGLHPFDLAGVLLNPQLALKRWNGAGYDDVAANNNWRDNINVAAIAAATAQVSAFPLLADRDAALLVDLAPGQYTVFADCADGGSGVAIVELYDADDPSTNSDARLVNLSNRGFAGIGDEVMIPGFVVSEEGPKTLLVRVVGPTLAAAPLNVAGAMVDPQLALYRHEDTGANTLLFTQDNWGESPDAVHTTAVAAQVHAFPLASGSKDAAFVVTLPPGVYTVVGSSADGASSGIVLVELYVVE